MNTMKKIFTTFLSVISATTCFSQQITDPGIGIGGAQSNYENHDRGTVNYQFQPLANCNPDFYDDLESGNTNNWTIISGSASVFTNNVIQGTYGLQHDNTQTGHFDGLINYFNNITPDYISYWAMSTNSGAYTSYFVIGDDNVTSNNGLIWIYFNIGGTIHFYSNGTNDMSLPYVVNQWYHIELKNIDWTNKEFDIYLDGNLEATNFAFRAPATTSLTRLHLYNYQPNTSGYYDVIQIGSGDPPVIASTSTDNICFGDTFGTIDITVTNGATPYSYSWSTGATTEDISNLGAGIYYITVTDDSNCVDIDSIIITEPPVLTLTTGTNDDLGNCDGDATANPGGGSTPYSYQWDANTGNQTTQTADSLCAGVYCVTVADDNGCTVTNCDTVDLFVGVREYLPVKGFKIIPNPTSGKARITNLPAGRQGVEFPITNVEVIDIFGKPVSVDFDIQSSTLDIGHLPKGVYFVKVGNVVKKLILQ